MVPSCAEGGVLGVLCASIGSIQVTEAIKLLTGIGEPLVGSLMVYDALEMSYRKIKVRKDPNCALCGENPTVTELDRLRRLLRRGLRRGAEAAHGSTITRQRAQGLAGRGQADPPGRRARAGRVRDRQDPGFDADPEGRHPLRPGARPTCRRTARSSCYCKTGVRSRRGAGRGEGGRLQGRRACPGWRVRLGQHRSTPRCPRTDRKEGHLVNALRAVAECVL